MITMKRNKIVRHNYGKKVLSLFGFGLYSLIPLSIYCVVIFIETFFIVGFFTNKLNYILGVLLLILHFSNWIVMDIAPIGQLAVIFFFLKYKDYTF